jgi:hypothetical protein
MMAPWLALTFFAAYNIVTSDKDKGRWENTDTEKGTDTGKDHFRRRECLQKKRVNIKVFMDWNSDNYQADTIAKSVREYEEYIDQWIDPLDQLLIVIGSLECLGLTPKYIKD